MYSTRYINKNVVDGNAYITVGDLYHDPLPNMFRQPKKGEKLTPFVAKLKPQNAENGNFTKVTYAPCAFNETNRYLDTQPLEARKNGFGSKDAFKTDEFCSAIRMEQYRDQLRRESQLMKKHSSKNDEILERFQTTRAQTSVEDNVYAQRVPSYDIGRTRVNKYNTKSLRDTYYTFEAERDKHLGPYRPMSVDTGGDAWNYNYKAPTYGVQSKVKNFFDKSHLRVGGR